LCFGRFARYFGVMERDRRPSLDGDHARRWRRDPFAPATFHRPPSGGAGGAETREPREPGTPGGEPTDAERPPSA